MRSDFRVCCWQGVTEIVANTNFVRFLSLKPSRRQPKRSNSAVRFCRHFQGLVALGCTRLGLVFPTNQALLFDVSWCQ